MVTGAGNGRIHSLLGQRWVRLLLTALVLVGCVAIAVRSIETARVFDAIRLADPLLLLVAVCVYALSWPVRGRRYNDILGAMDSRCGTWFGTAAVFVSQLANLAVPARAGDGFRAYLMKRRRGVPYTTGAASLTVERLFDLLALAVFGSLAAVALAVQGHSLASGRVGRYLAAGAGVAAVALVLATLALILSRRELPQAVELRHWIDNSRLGWLVDSLVEVGSDVRAVATDRPALLRVGTGSLAIWALDSLTAVLVLWAVTGSAVLSPSLVVTGTLAVTVGNLAKVLPLSQGGIGLYEAAFTAVVVTTAPITAAMALGAAILDHALKNGVTVLGGVGSAVAVNVSPRTVGRESPEPESSDF